MSKKLGSQRNVVKNGSFFSCISSHKFVSKTKFFVNNWNDLFVCIHNWRMNLWKSWLFATLFDIVVLRRYFYSPWIWCAGSGTESSELSFASAKSDCLFSNESMWLKGMEPHQRTCALQNVFVWWTPQFPHSPFQVFGDHWEDLFESLLFWDTTDRAYLNLDCFWMWCGFLFIVLCRVFRASRAEPRSRFVQQTNFRQEQIWLSQVVSFGVFFSSRSWTDSCDTRVPWFWT